MYADTTPLQIVRAVAAWVLGAGIALFPLVARSILAGRPSTAAWVCLGIIAVGAGGILGAKRGLARLDRRNRPFLLSPDGVSIMVPRASFLRRATLIKRVLLGLFLMVGTLFIVFVSAVNCAEGQGGFCGSAPSASDATLTFLQLTAIGLGLFYIAFVVLTRTHDAETERLDKVIAHGQYERRHGGPMGGVSRRGWE